MVRLSTKPSQKLFFCAQSLPTSKTRIVTWYVYVSRFLILLRCFYRLQGLMSDNKVPSPLPVILKTTPIRYTFWLVELRRIFCQSCLSLIGNFKRWYLVQWFSLPTSMHNNFGLHPTLVNTRIERCLDKHYYWGNAFYIKLKASNSLALKLLRKNTDSIVILVRVQHRFYYALEFKYDYYIFEHCKQK